MARWHLIFQLQWSIDTDKALRAGIEFQDLAGAESDQIHHLVCEIEREIIRKLKKLD